MNRISEVDEKILYIYWPLEGHRLHLTKNGDVALCGTKMSHPCCSPHSFCSRYHCHKCRKILRGLLNKDRKSLDCILFGPTIELRLIKLPNDFEKVRFEDYLGKKIKIYNKEE